MNYIKVICFLLLLSSCNFLDSSKEAQKNALVSSDGDYFNGYYKNI